MPAQPGAPVAGDAVRHHVTAADHAGGVNRWRQTPAAIPAPLSRSVGAGWPCLGVVASALRWRVRAG